MSLELRLIILVFGPLLGAVLAGLFGRRLGNRTSMYLTTGLLALSACLAWNLFLGFWLGKAVPETFTLAPFITVGDFRSFWSIRLDSLSAVMLVVVTTVSALVHIYSIGYMAEDASKPRFFAYLSLFTFAMLMLVTAADFLQLFFGWEGVGLASYLLIGFWFEKDSASSAAIKAFVVNRVGDFGFALGIMTVFWIFHTVRFAELAPLWASKIGAHWSFLGQEFRALDLAGILLFIGAMGKSAQFFLHTWLPDAMEGPTPVSALIHAATMVTAGVYMVCLLSPLYEAAPMAREVITLIGVVTAFFAATVGLMQNDIKRVIAYSTCSQLGYMFFAAGVGAYQAAMFHLFTHAFFKALLFLGAGSVIHAMHHEQDMRKMGALYKVIPLTYAVMMIGTIAITGLGLPIKGMEFGFAGFFSKDTILSAAYAAGKHQTFGYFAYIVGVLSAGLTAYYSWRLIFMTFHGKPQWKTVEATSLAHGHAQIHQKEPDHSHDNPHHKDHGHEPHESPLVMLLPLFVLAFGAVVAGFVFAPYFTGGVREVFWQGAIFVSKSNKVLDEVESLPAWVGLAPLVVSVIGALAAIYVYLLHEGLAKRLSEKNGLLYRFLLHKWYFDELYQVVFVRGMKWLGDVFWKIGDRKLIDGLGPNGFAKLAQICGRSLGRFQSGYVYHYAFVMLLGLAGLLSYALWLFGR